MPHLGCIPPLIAAAAIVLPSALHADLPAIDDLPVVLTVNLTNLSAVTFMATGAVSYNNDGIDAENGRWSGSDGILLTEFLKKPPRFFSADGTSDSNLRHAGFKPAEDFGDRDFNFLLAAGFGNTPFHGENALSITAGYSYDRQKFRIDLPAFFGELTVDFADQVPGFLSLLQDVGYTGYLYSGYDENAVVIGTWTVVPEPSITAIVMMGGLLLVGLVRQYRSRKSRG